MFIAYQALDDCKKNTIIKEIAELKGVSYDYNYNCAHISFRGFEDIYLPMDEKEYDSLYNAVINAITNKKVLIINGLVIFDTEHYDISTSNLKNIIKLINNSVLTNNPNAFIYDYEFK